MELQHCRCSINADLAESKIFQLSHRLNLMIRQSPQYSKDILVWLKHTCDYLPEFEALLMQYEHKGDLELDCTQCKYTKNIQNNSPHPMQHM